MPRGKQALVDVIGRFRDAGVTWTSVPMRQVASVEEYLDVLQWTAEEVCAPFRADPLTPARRSCYIESFTFEVEDR